MTDAESYESSALPPNVRETIVTVGTFDGVHRGHRDVVERLVNRARELGIASVLVTFDPHPMEIVNPSAAPPLLTTMEEKLEVLAETGLEYLAVVPFTATLSRYSAEHFVDLVLRRCFRMRELLIGYDHGFGRQRAGNVEVLKSLGKKSGFKVDVVAPVQARAGQAVSSTAIRRAVAGGDLRRAAESLGRHYSVSGEVIPGDQRGRSVGFPTVNLGKPSTRKLLPPEGVYAVRAQTPRGNFGGMMNLGPRPTFGDAVTSIEAHLFDTDETFYGDHVRLDFIARLRDTRKFGSVDELRAQLRIDERNARRALTLNSDSDNLTG